jgi:hypothetical protein
MYTRSIVIATPGQRNERIPETLGGLLLVPGPKCGARPTGPNVCGTLFFQAPYLAPGPENGARPNGPNVRSLVPFPMAREKRPDRAEP